MTLCNDILNALTEVCGTERLGDIVVDTFFKSLQTVFERGLG